MARTLSEHDIALLLKLAPECDTLICKGSENAYRSILPPVANHYAKDADDFAMRLNRLTDEEFVALVDLIREGKEGIRRVCWCFNRADTSPCGAGCRKRTLCPL